MSSEFLVAMPIEEMQNGSVYAVGEPLPLQCTLMYWFELDDLRAGGRISDQIEMICASFGKEKLVLRPSGRALFGLNDDVPVTTIECSNEISFLHTSLLLALARERARFKELRWVGAGYRPHVSDLPGRSLDVRLTYESGHIALISRGEDKAKMVISLCQFRL